MGRFDLATGKKPLPEQKLYVMSVEEEVNFVMEAHKKAIEGLTGLSLKEAETKFVDQLTVMKKSKQISKEAYNAACIIYKIKNENAIEKAQRNLSIYGGYSTGCSSVTPSRTC